MSDYTKVNNFAAKDAINAPVVGEEFQNEFDAIQTAVNSKADSLNPALTGVPTTPTPDGGTANQITNVDYVDNVVSTELNNYYTKSESETRYVNANNTGTESMAGDLLVNGIRLDRSQNRITGLNSPTASNHAATKGYVDGRIATVNQGEPARTTLFTGAAGSGDISLSSSYTNFDYLEIYLGTSDSLGGHIVSVDSIEYARSIGKDYEFTAGADLFWRIRPDTNRSRLRYISDRGTIYRVVGIKY